jgi:mevalonate kinase
MLNSVLSDWQFVPELMNSCQSLLSIAGVSTPKIDAFVNQLQSQAIQYQIDREEPLVKIGAKLTGAGKGGNLIIVSLYDIKLHQDLIEQVANHNYPIHWSCTVHDLLNVSVKGVQKES